MTDSATPRKHCHREDRTRQSGVGKTIDLRRHGPGSDQPVHADKSVRTRKSGRHRGPATDRRSPAGSKRWVDAPAGSTDRSQSIYRALTSWRVSAVRAVRLKFTHQNRLPASAITAQAGPRSLRVSEWD